MLGPRKITVWYRQVVIFLLNDSWKGVIGKCHSSENVTMNFDIFLFGAQKVRTVCTLGCTRRFRVVPPVGTTTKPDVGAYF